MPRCTTGGTFLLAIFLLQRACNAMQVEGVVTRTRQHRAVVAGDAAVRACRLELLSADATRVAFAVPHPFGDQVNAFHLHLHAFSVVTEKKKKEIIARNRYIRQSALLQTTTTTTTKRRKKKNEGKKKDNTVFCSSAENERAQYVSTTAFHILEKSGADL